MNWKIAAAGFAVFLSACSTSDGVGFESKSAVRAFTGASTASQQPVAAAIMKALSGGLIGSSLGQGLDSRDRRLALEAEYRALEYTPAGQAVSWGDADDHGGRVVAGSPYRVGSQDCRQYTHTVFAGPRSQIARGSACRNPDGSWTLLA
jgi:surface antigen